MLSVGWFWQILLLLVTIAATCDALTCMRCQNGTDPRSCRTVATCGHGEVCYVEEVITASGQIVFHSGCMPHSQCSFHSGASMAIGRRREPRKRALSAITTCLECCTGDNCNVGGCGKTVLPRSQRGPYCFTCTHTSAGKTCNQVTQCAHGEICGLYTPRQYLSSPEEVFEGTCMSKPMCAAIHGTYVSTRCVPTCCDTDYCNVGCNSSHSHLTTQPPGTHLTTQPPRTHLTTRPPGTHSGTPAPTGAHTTTMTPAFTVVAPILDNCAKDSACDKCPVGETFDMAELGTDHMTVCCHGCGPHFTTFRFGSHFSNEIVPACKCTHNGTVGASSTTMTPAVTVVAPILDNCAKDSACDKCPVGETFDMAELGSDHMTVCCHGCGPHFTTFRFGSHFSNEIVPACKCTHNGTVI